MPEPSRRDLPELYGTVRTAGRQDITSRRKSNVIDSICMSWKRAEKLRFAGRGCGFRQRATNSRLDYRSDPKGTDCECGKRGEVGEVLARHILLSNYGYLRTEPPAIPSTETVAL
jgi:hypothetical protein